jgi:hypothetical protein
MNQQVGGDRVLRTRLESMNLVLEGLQQLSMDVTSARKGLDDLNVQINEMGALLNGVTKLATTVKSELGSMAEEMEIFNVTKNDNYLVKAEDLRAQSDNAAQLRRELLQLRQFLSVDAWTAVRDLRRWSPLSHPRVDIDLELRNAAAALGKKVGFALHQEKSWAFFREQVQGTCDELFAQYVDLVGGIALRDQGLDRRVSRHADVLVTLLLESFGGRGALAVPSRHAPQALIQAQHVRIPLPPGWTLWSLPLVARGVGELLRRDLHDIPFPQLLPDVFGVFVTGPAYAFAAILFELDPGDDHHHQRAQVILDVMRRLDEHDDSRRFSRLADEIGQQWDAATTSLASGGAKAAALGDGVLDNLFDQVRMRCENAAYLPEDRWDMVEELSESLLKHESGAPEPGADLRDVLNAMWLARWQKPDALDTIDERSTEAAEGATMTGGDQNEDRPAGSTRTKNR